MNTQTRESSLYHTQYAPCYSTRNRRSPGKSLALGGRNSIGLECLDGQLLLLLRIQVKTRATRTHLGHAPLRCSYPCCAAVPSADTERPARIFVLCPSALYLQIQKTFEETLESEISNSTAYFSPVTFTSWPGWPCTETAALVSIYPCTVYAIGSSSPQRIGSRSGLPQVFGSRAPYSRTAA